MSTVNIDHPFLSKCLGDRFEILEFHVTAGSKPGDNFLSLIYSVDVKLRDTEKNETTSRHLILKCYPTHPARQDYNNQINVFYRELEIYRIWLPELVKFQKEILGMNEAELFTPPYPPFINGKATDYSKVDFTIKKDSSTAMDPLENFILMEDLRKTWGFKMTDRRGSFDLNHIKLVIPALAKLHATSWAYKHHVTSEITEKFCFLKNSFREEDLDTWAQVGESNFDQMKVIMDEFHGEGNKFSEAIQQFKPKQSEVLKVFLDLANPTAYENAMRIKLDPSTSASIKDPWKVFVHGDCWSNNMLFRYDSTTGRPVQVLLVDLQMAMDGCPTMDLTYVIYASCRTDLRKAHLPSLLQLYVDTFNDTCAKLRCPTLPGFSLETLSARFHRASPQGFVTASMLLPIMLKEEGQTINLDELDPTQDITEIFGSAINEGNDRNQGYKDRVIELVHEMYDLGVL